MIRNVLSPTGGLRRKFIQLIFPQIKVKKIMIPFRQPTHYKYWYKALNLDVKKILEAKKNLDPKFIVQNPCRDIL